MASLPLVGVAVLDLSPLVVILGLPTLTEATPPGPSPTEIFTPNVIVFQREEEEVGQVGVVRGAVETTIREVEEGVGIGTEGMMTQIRRSHHG
jgi:hypothetical protein